MRQESQIVPVVAALLVWTVTIRAQDTPAIVEAAKTGDVASLRALVTSGADVNAPQGDGATALHWAAHRNDVEAVELLLEAGATADRENDLGATALWLASTSGSAEVIAALLEAGTDPNVTLRMGETPLMAAARSGNLPVLELLLEHGADVNAAEHERGQTALMWAAAQRQSTAARLLVDRGANLHARTRVWHQLENTAGNTNGSGNFLMAHGGSTPLVFAVRSGDPETARVLIEAGADIDAVTASGTSPLVVAAHSGHASLAISLLEQGADPNLSGAGYTALHAAVLRGELGLVAALIAHGADPNAVVNRGTPGRRFSADYSLRHQVVGANAFWMAAKYGELEILRFLADSGGDARVTPYDGESSLKAAMGVPQISQENRRNRVGIPVPDAADEEQLTLGLAQIALDLGVDVNRADDSGNTALHDAVRRGFGLVVEFLVSHGAALEVANERGQTPLHVAETPQPIYGTNGLRTTRPEIATLLRSLGATR